MKTTQVLFVVSLIIGLIAACSTTPPQPTQSVLMPSPLASPLPATGTAAVQFKLDRPLVTGSTEIRGSGPAGVPVYIADITFMGESLGTGTIGPDGKFAIAVKPLEAQHRLGLRLGILDGTAWKPEDFYRQEFYGPEAMQMPQVGFFHDTALVEQR